MTEIIYQINIISTRTYILPLVSLHTSTSTNMVRTRSGKGYGDDAISSEREGYNVQDTYTDTDTNSDIDPSVQEYWKKRCESRLDTDSDTDTQQEHNASCCVCNENDKLNAQYNKEQVTLLKEKVTLLEEQVIRMKDTIKDLMSDLHYESHKHDDTDADVSDEEDFIADNLDDLCK